MKVVELGKKNEREPYFNPRIDPRLMKYETDEDDQEDSGRYRLEPRFANSDKNDEDDVVAFCTNCGIPVSPIHRFCRTCGSEQTA